MKIVVSCLALIFGGLILMLSLIRSGWETTIITVSGDALRTEPVFFEVRKDDGGVEKRIYRIPDTLVLPNNPLYRLKTTRDLVWYLMAKNPRDKSEMARLIADKRLGEALKSGGGQEKLLTEAVDWLITARGWLEKPNHKVLEASLVYQYEIEVLNNNGGLDDVKYLDLVKKLKEIENEEFQKN